MGCDVLDFTIKDIGKCIDRIYADSFIFAKPMQQGFTDMVVFSQIILSDTFFFYDIPKFVIFNHNNNYLHVCNDFKWTKERKSGLQSQLKKIKFKTNRLYLENSMIFRDAFL